MIGVGLLIGLGFATLLLPSEFAALVGYRGVLLVAFGALLLASLVVLLRPSVLMSLRRWHYSRWLATLAEDAHRVLLGHKGPLIIGLGCLIHALTIVIVWSLGCAQGLTLSIFDAAVLVTIMLGVSLVPVSISGWGLRELAVISLLSHHGVAAEKALIFSMCFGLALAIASLPGAVTWMLYSFAPSSLLTEQMPTTADLAALLTQDPIAHKRKLPVT
jgi:glycosyltransferase 2 family protein